MKALRAHRALPLLLVAILLSGCASIGGGDPVVVRTQDVLENSLNVYESAMSVHMANSEKETPDVYRALEKVRKGFPPAWRGLSSTLDTYRAAKTKDPEQLRAAVLAFLDEAERDGPASWKSAIGFIRKTFTDNVPGRP